MKIDWEALPAARGLRAGMTRRCVCAEKMSAVRVRNEPGTLFDGRLHWHDNEQILIMLEGAVTLQINDDTLEAVAGDFVVFPAGSRHGALSVGPQGCSYYEIFAPARPDQLPGGFGPGVMRYGER